MAGFAGKVVATAAGIALYEVVVRPLVASRLMGSQDELEDGDDVNRELDEADAELARAERELDAEDEGFLDQD